MWLKKTNYFHVNDVFVYSCYSQGHVLLLIIAVYFETALTKKEQGTVIALSGDFVCVCSLSNLPFTYVCKNTVFKSSTFYVGINVRLLFYLPADLTVISHALTLVLTRRNSHMNNKRYSRPLDHHKDVKDWKEYDILCKGSRGQFKFRKLMLKHLQWKCQALKKWHY